VLPYLASLLITFVIDPETHTHISILTRDDLFTKLQTTYSTRYTIYYVLLATRPRQLQLQPQHQHQHLSHRPSTISNQSNITVLEQASDPTPSATRPRPAPTSTLILTLIRITPGHQYNDKIRGRRPDQGQDRGHGTEKISYCSVSHLRDSDSD
jgi:hypothetical protein